MLDVTRKNYKPNLNKPSSDSNTDKDFFYTRYPSISTYPSSHQQTPAVHNIPPNTCAINPLSSYASSKWPSDV